MADLSIPDPNSEFTKCLHCGNSSRINEVWFRKLTQWLKKTNQDSLSTNGRLTVTATSDTNIRFSYRGSDDVVRVANVTLV